jgi:hypothetical protein
MRGWKSDDIDERRETASSLSDNIDAAERTFRLLTEPSNTAAADNPEIASFAALRKLVVDESWRMFEPSGGTLPACERCERPPGTFSEPMKVGVVARCMSSGGGGEEGRGGGISR